MPSKRKPQPSAPSAEEMLRWLERRDVRITRWSISLIWCVETRRLPYVCGERRTLRAAIRAAMRAEKGGRRG